MIDKFDTTIVAPATTAGGAIAVIRLSGKDARRITESIFSATLKARTAVLGLIRDEHKMAVDEVLCTYFQEPASYTGEDCVEISCHGSGWIVNEIMRLLTTKGAIAAIAGEFTMRAFMGGKMDLAQAEAVADLIASQSRAAAGVALQQMRGGYSHQLRDLSQQLLHVASLLELELDFGEEDVVFADRGELKSLIDKIQERLRELINSFSLGNVLKNGVAVAIVGRPNVGKSTLLNRLLGEERAIVSATAGTTRDFIEETLVIGGVLFRFIDTAGLRSSQDEIERIGIERSYQKLRTANVVIELTEAPEELEKLELTTEQKHIIVVNKCDQLAANSPATHSNMADSHQGAADTICKEDTMTCHQQNAGTNTGTDSQKSTTIFCPQDVTTPYGTDTPCYISAKYGTGIDDLKALLLKQVGVSNYNAEAVVVSNVRHCEALKQSSKAFQRANAALNGGLPTDLISAEIRIALLHIGEITGEITTDDILKNIFSKFCIGK
ncbi:MAG: tRNA uridine-5-carboxymethylaminomethyl(34) synthesis GTPase MnmE [Mucinivorans sp.]